MPLGEGSRPGVEPKAVPKADVSQRTVEHDLASALDLAVPRDITKSMSPRKKFDSYLSLVNGSRTFHRESLDAPAPDYRRFLEWLRDVAGDQTLLSEGEPRADYQRLYKGYLAEQANWELLKRFLINVKKFPSDVIDPEAEQAADLNLDAIPASALEEYFQPLASGQARPMRYVGLHTSNKSFGGDIMPGQSSENYGDAIEGVPSTGWTFYSLDPEHLVNGKWLYFVEVSRNDVKEAIRQTEEKRIGSSVYTPSNEWVGSRAPLHVIEKVPLTPHLAQAYGLKFIK